MTKRTFINVAGVLNPEMFQGQIRFRHYGAHIRLITVMLADLLEIIADCYGMTASDIVKLIADDLTRPSRSIHEGSNKRH